MWSPASAVRDGKNVPKKDTHTHTLTHEKTRKITGYGRECAHDLFFLSQNIFGFICHWNQIRFLLSLAYRESQNYRYTISAADVFSHFWSEKKDQTTIFCCFPFIHQFLFFSIVCSNLCIFAIYGFWVNQLAVFGKKNQYKTVCSFASVCHFFGRFVLFRYLLRTLHILGTKEKK